MLSVYTCFFPYSLYYCLLKHRAEARFEIFVYNQFYDLDNRVLLRLYSFDKVNFDMAIKMKYNVQSQ